MRNTDARCKPDGRPFPAPGPGPRYPALDVHQVPGIGSRVPGNPGPGTWDPCPIPTSQSDTTAPRVRRLTARPPTAGRPAPGPPAGTCPSGPGRPECRPAEPRQYPSRCRRRP